MSDHENARPPRAGARLSQSADGQNAKDPKYWATEHDGIKYARPFNGRFYKEKANEVKHSGAFLLPDGRSAVIINSNTPHKWHWPKTPHEKKMADDAVRQYWTKYHFPPSKHYEFREKKNREGAWIKPGTPGPFGYTRAVPPPPAAAGPNHANHRAPQPQPVAQGQVYRPGPARPVPQNYVPAPAPQVNVWSQRSAAQQQVQPQMPPQAPPPAAVVQATLTPLEETAAKWEAALKVNHGNTPVLPGVYSLMPHSHMPFRINPHATFPLTPAPVHVISVPNDTVPFDANPSVSLFVGVLANNLLMKICNNIIQEINKFVAQTNYKRYVGPKGLKIDQFLTRIKQFKDHYNQKIGPFQGREYEKPFPPMLGILADFDLEVWKRAHSTVLLKGSDYNVLKNQALLWFYEHMDYEEGKPAFTEASEETLKSTMEIMIYFFQFVRQDVEAMLFQHLNEAYKKKLESNTANAMDQQTGGHSHGVLRVAAAAYKEYMARENEHVNVKALQNPRSREVYIKTLMENKGFSKHELPSNMLYELVRDGSLPFAFFNKCIMMQSEYMTACRMYKESIQGVPEAAPASVHRIDEDSD